MSNEAGSKEMDITSRQAQNHVSYAVHAHEEASDNSPSHGRLARSQREIISSLLRNSQNASSAYLAAMDAKEALLRHECDRSVTSANSQRDSAFTALQECQALLQEITTDRSDCLEELVVSKEEISKLKIQEGAYAREVKRLALETRKLENLHVELESIRKLNRSLVIERGRYARERTAFEKSNDVLKHRLVQLESDFENNFTKLLQVSEINVSLEKRLESIHSSKRYKFASLLGNEGNTFIGSISLLWKIPRFLFKNR
ncbi:hypothetical protein ACTXMY_00010 [Glutamicibacter ardleyensis]|uniref:hypothetical protein n=1 Tax=Glutamicibacter ardleyensis TaxID=225894 RepID=UPI003FD58C2C